LRFIFIRQIIITVSFLLIAACKDGNKNINENNAHPFDLNKDWRLGMQLWTFHKYSFMEALEKTASLGIKWVEAYPGQILLDDKPHTKFNQFMSPEERQMVKDKLRELDLKLVNFGVVYLPDNEEECRTVFNFAKDMGLETIVSEPPEDAWDLIEKLCIEYKINVVIHNHPKPTRYWNPDKVASIIADRSDYIGACADIGHWMRSGVNPVQALQILEGKIKDFHFGDLNSFGELEAHDVIWGTGVGDVEEVLDEMRRQRYRGVISIEYKYNWTASIPEIEESITFFNEYVKKHRPDSGCTDNKKIKNTVSE
jgi:sugar phosphate isomerase/epimerase